ncbi:MAG: energy transducer TonB family protein [Hyphomicrobium sp.]
MTSPNAIAAASISASLAWHAALALAAITWQPQREPGAIKTQTDAISVELAATEVVEARDNAQETAASASSLAMQDGAMDKVAVDPTPDPVKAIDPATTSAAPVIETMEPMPSPDIQGIAAGNISAVEGTLEPDQSAEGKLRDRTVELAPPQPRAVRESTQKPTPPSKVKPMAEERSTAIGGPASKSAAGASGASGRISATSGDIRSYAARVRARVASRRPSGNGARGTVRIQFTVMRSGALGGARIALSSGNGALDAAALNAVRGAGSFDPPPGRSGPLIFSVPFHYR